MTKDVDLNADYAEVCKDCTRNAELSADCADCDLKDRYGLCVCDDCDLNPQGCENCEMHPTLSRKTVAEVLVASLSDKPVILTYVDVEYDWPIQWTIKRETDTLVSVDGWWDLGDGLFSPINDQSIDDNTLVEKDAVKRVNALFKMGAYLKPS